MAQHVRVAARADVDEGVGPETEGRLQALKHVIGTLPESHPRRELRLSCLEYPRRPRLRHAGKPKRETKFVSFLGGQLASHRERSISAPPQSNSRRQCRASSHSAFARRGECEPLERAGRGVVSACVCTSSPEHLSRHQHEYPGKAGEAVASGSDRPDRPV
jgi:hypothetical protein